MPVDWLKWLEILLWAIFLLNDADRSDEYKKSADLFSQMVLAENHQKFKYIENFDLKDLGLFKIA